MKTLLIGAVAALAIGTGAAVFNHLSDPLNASCGRVLLDPYHEGRAAADRVNAFLNDGGGDSYFAMVAMCQASPGISVAQVAEDIRDQSAYNASPVAVEFGPAVPGVPLPGAADASSR